MIGPGAALLLAASLSFDAKPSPTPYRCESVVKIKRSISSRSYEVDGCKLKYVWLAARDEPNRLLKNEVFG